MYCKRGIHKLLIVIHFPSVLLHFTFHRFSFNPVGQTTSNNWKKFNLFKSRIFLCSLVKFTPKNIYIASRNLKKTTTKDECFSPQFLKLAKPLPAKSFFNESSHFLYEQKNTLYCLLWNNDEVQWRHGPSYRQGFFQVKFLSC